MTMRKPPSVRFPDWVEQQIRTAEAGLLPPALALAKEVEDLPVRLLGERTEQAVRSVVDDLNTRIDRAYAAPQLGPPLRVRRVRVDDAVEQWRGTRAEVAARRAEAAAAREARPDPAPQRGRWRRQRRSDRVHG